MERPITHWGRSLNDSPSTALLAANCRAADGVIRQSASTWTRALTRPTSVIHGVTRGEESQPLCQGPAVNPSQGAGRHSGDKPQRVLRGKRLAKRRQEFRSFLLTWRPQFRWVQRIADKMQWTAVSRQAPLNCDRVLPPRAQRSSARDQKE
jgi:hypothetical protein